MAPALKRPAAAAKRPAASLRLAKKPAASARALKRPAAVLKKPEAKRPAGSMTALKKPATKRPAASSTALKRPAVKRPAASSTALKRPAVKRPAIRLFALRKPAAKRPATSSRVLKKPVVQMRPEAKQPAASLRALLKPLDAAARAAAAVERQRRKEQAVVEKKFAKAEAELLRRAASAAWQVEEAAAAAGKASRRASASEPLAALEVQLPERQPVPTPRRHVGGVRCKEGHICTMTSRLPPDVTPTKQQLKEGRTVVIGCDECEREDIVNSCAYFFHCSICGYDICQTCGGGPKPRWGLDAFGPIRFSSGSVVCSDPGYEAEMDMPPSRPFRANVKFAMLPGDWICRITLVDDTPLGSGRVGVLGIHHKRHPLVPSISRDGSLDLKGLAEPSIRLQLGVDTGRFGFFDAALYRNDAASTEAGFQSFDRLMQDCDPTDKPLPDNAPAVVATSGFGDGRYELCCYMEGELLKAAFIRFITDEEESKVKAVLSGAVTPLRGEVE